MLDVTNTSNLVGIFNSFKAVFEGWDLDAAKIYFLLFIIYSFGGWIIEEVHCSIIQKKIVNRGFLIGPILPIYGTGAVIMTFFLTRYSSDPFLLFCMAILSCGSVEYFASFVMEKLFHARWWDYSKSKFNLNGRVCLGTIIPFGVFGLIIIYFSNPIFVPFLKDFQQTNVLWFDIITWTLVILTITDTIISLILISKVRATATKISNENKKDDTDEITAKVKKEIRKQFMGKRLLNAFPQLQTFGNKVKIVANRVVEKEGTFIEEKKNKAIEVAEKTKKEAIEVAKKQKDAAMEVAKRKKDAAVEVAKKQKEKVSNKFKKNKE